MAQNTKIQKLMACLDDAEAGIILSEQNRLYTTGQKTSAGTVIVTKDKSYFIIDFRYFNKVKDRVVGIEMILQDKLFDQINEILAKHGIKKCYFELSKIPYAQVKTFRNALNILISDDSTFDDALLNLRMIKDDDELCATKKAQEITDKTFEHILNFIKPGKSEIDVALEMEFFGRKNGADAVSFDFIVVSGKKSALPHGSPDEKIIQKGDFLTMDFGFIVDGYCSDMTRTVSIGAPSQKQKDVYNIVLNSQNLAIAAIKPALTGAQVDKIARDYIEENGFGKYFGHGLGHGVGIDIHEAPTCGKSGTEFLMPRMIITCEPGIYIENEFGVRIEDMGFVTETGFNDISKSPKELIII